MGLWGLSIGGKRWSITRLSSTCSVINLHWILNLANITYITKLYNVCKKITLKYSNCHVQRPYKFLFISVSLHVKDVVDILTNLFTENYTMITLGSFIADIWILSYPIPHHENEHVLRHDSIRSDQLTPGLPRFLCWFLVTSPLGSGCFFCRLIAQTSAATNDSNARLPTMPPTVNPTTGSAEMVMVHHTCSEWIILG